MSDAIKTIQIPDDQKLVSFDVKSLFTSIPLQLALDCTKTAINKSHYQPPLPTDDLMDLLHLCLTSTYFQYNGKHYKQLHGTAMGSPVSVVVAEIVMQNIKEQALGTYSETLPLWLRYVDDTITAVHKILYPKYYTQNTIHKILYLNILSQPRPCQLLKRHLRLTFFVATSVMSNVTFVV